ncbi:hypothetical protein HPB50_010675 [Hyalomma asiaticum]|uniref:Uncharacterized protein n=1 Tax=Hyalomma asiaticum TaxID=266040 RepID=A0ACB7SG69_HYAAI|nr:hypothetical protein HPB50_010675 [Hyalomma asiaticum]
MAALIQVVARQAQLTFARGFFADEAFRECLSRLQRTIGQVTCKDVNLDEKLLHALSRTTNGGNAAPVTYISLYESRVFSMSIFIIRRGERIPLHDHPGMFGVLKVLHGSGTICSYSPLMSHNGDEAVFEAQRHPDLTVAPDSAPCCLTPTERNLHEIRALDGPLAFLDILAPPYDSVERDCHYYSVTATSAEEGNVRLRRVAPPRDFWCESAPYRGPPIAL